MALYSAASFVRGVWGLGTGGCEMSNLGTSRIGRGDMWDGDSGRQKQGRGDVIDY